MGISRNTANSGRSDSIMILTIDSKNNSIKLTSIIKISYVNIPGRGMDKINYAFAFGKAPLTLKAINKNFNLDIDRFIATNFSTLPKIVDTVGVVELNITSKEVSHIPGINSSGTYPLNGNKALAYSIIRYTSGGDYQRTARQRTVIIALYKKALTLSPTEFPIISNEYLPFVETNMTILDLLDLGNKIITIGNQSIH